MEVFFCNKASIGVPKVRKELHAMIGREDKKLNDLFFTCSLIECIGRRTCNERVFIVDTLGRETIEKIYDLADVYHCEDIKNIADDFIEKLGIPNGTFDNVSTCKYDVPTVWDIGKVFKRLIRDIALDENIPIVDALFKAYHSFICAKIEDFNSSVFYDAPQNIFLAYKHNSFIF